VSPPKSSSFDQHLARIGTQQAGDDGNCRGFSSAVRAEQADGLACGGAQRDAIDGYLIAIALLQSYYFEHGFPKCTVDCLRRTAKSDSTLARTCSSYNVVEEYEC
jgi:hypothetical protein